MHIVVTDCGYFWNHENPILKKYKESVTVVCLNGKKVTDEYRCFVSPYYGEMHGQMFGRVPSVFERDEYRVLEEHSSELMRQFGYHEDIVFLTDHSEESCFPFWVLYNKKSYNSYHLCSIVELPFYRRFTERIHSNRDLSNLWSIFMLGIEKSAQIMYQKGSKASDVNQNLTEYMEGIFPHVLNGIHNLRERSYFDFASMQYVPLTDGFENIDVSNKDKVIDKIDFDISPQGGLLGCVVFPEYPSKEPYILKNTEQLTARIDGKKICNILRDQRIRLAEANNIPFESVECPSIGPCAGTCRKCDSEAAFLRDELEKIPPEKRVYPQFDVLEEMKK